MARPAWHLRAYLGGMAALSAVAIDHYFDVRKWKRVSFSDCRGVAVSLRARTRPPPIGAMEWPSGRVILQWALDSGLGAASSGPVLEIGSGIGLTSIGLALARQHEGNGKGSLVVATDCCDDSLALLRENAASNGVTSDALRVSRWDAAAGATSLARLPLPVAELEHVIAADCVYHGFGADTDPSGHGLERTLAALLAAKPSLNVQLLVKDRFSGGAVAALCDAAGVNTTSAPATVDPALVRFVGECARLGLSVTQRPVPSEVLDRVAASLWPLERATWWLASYTDGLSVLSITPAKERRRGE